MTNDVLRLMVPSLLLPVAAALLAGCLGTLAASPRDGGGKSARVRLGREFKLRVGGKAVVKGEGLRVRFDSVENDSRCPQDVACVWAGNAEVLIEAEAGGSRELLKLNTHGGENYPKQVRHRQYVCELVALNPKPASGRETKAADYEVTLIIRKV